MRTSYVDKVIKSYSLSSGPKTVLAGQSLELFALDIPSEGFHYLEELAFYADALAAGNVWFWVRTGYAPIPRPWAQRNTMLGQIGAPAVLPEAYPLLPTVRLVIGCTNLGGTDCPVESDGAVNQYAKAQ